jgi:hypothetical protein
MVTCCSQCDQMYRVQESRSLLPQAFCSKGCEITALVAESDQSEFDFSQLLCAGDLSAAESRYAVN